jgi:GGDEF domain-containing protein
MLSGPPRRRRARPVADAPVDVLLSRGEDLAKGWLLALLEQAPLDDAPAILAADLARDGPRVCEAVLRALTDDTDLRRLEPGGALTPLASRVGALAGAAGPAATVRAVDALHAVIWAALRDELRSPAPELVSDLAERLTLVTEQLRAAALGREESAPGPTVRAVADDPAVTHISPSTHDRGESARGESAREESARGESAREESARGESAREEPARGETARERSWPEAAAASTQGPQPLWIGALTDEIQRSAGQPLSLLLAELEDADRVTVAEGHEEAGATFGEFAKAVRSVVRRQDILVCETDSRAWIIARETGRGGAQALGERITDAVRNRRPWRGGPLTASVGVAVLGEDGRTPDELIEAAEEARFAAEASGIGVIGAVADETPVD